MKHWIISTIVFLALATILIWLLSKAPKTKVTGKEIKPTTKSVSTHLVEIIQAPVKIPESTTKANAISKLCLVEGHTWLSLDLNKFGQRGDGSNLMIDLEDGQGFVSAIIAIRPKKKCEGLLEPVLKGIYDELWSSCQTIKDNDIPSIHWAHSVQSCMVAVLNFRMAFLDRITATIPLSEIKEEEILTMKMLAAVFVPSKANEVSMMANVERTALRLLEVNPNNLDAVLYLVSAKRRQLELLTEQSERERLILDISRAVERLETLAPDNWDSAAAQFSFAKAQQDFIKMEQIGTKLTNANDNFLKSEGLYYLAWTHYEKGETEEAISLLRKATNLDSGNSRPKDSLQILTSKAKSKELPFIDIAPGFKGIGVAGPPFQK